MDFPEKVEVELTEGPQTMLLTLTVDKRDVGKIVGRNGQNADALRTLVKATGSKLRRRYHLNIIESDDLPIS